MTNCAASTFSGPQSKDLACAISARPVTLSTPMIDTPGLWLGNRALTASLTAENGRCSEIPVTFGAP